jgi:DNA-binding XRE family transcriptional regulator
MNGESGGNVIPFPTRAEPVGDRPVHTASEHTASEHTGPEHTELEHTGPEHTGPADSSENRFAQPGSDPSIAPGDPQPLWREVAGGIFRCERIAQGRTLGQVAERAGISPQYLSEVERGRKEPSSEMVESICGSLGLSLADLLFAGGRWLRVGGSEFSAPMAGSRSHPGTPTGPTLMARLTG